MTADFLASEAASRMPVKEDHGLRSIASENFFSQAPILREEALFSMLDRGPGWGNGPVKPPRRRSLRLFAGGRVKNLDLGFATLGRDAERASMTLQQGDETGFLLLIKGPGVYKLKGLTIRAFPKENAETPGFYAAPPLALRQQYPGDYIIRGGRKRRGTECVRGAGISASGLITAEDARGPAAFIGRRQDGQVIVLAREEEARENRLFFHLL
jgi:hypothetical protein